ncbi:multiple stress resistance protein BhsA [Sodalis ligni]|uniref:Multiple stress resistance protein BhsA n=1 Tax=Sodalis ligni TaxID=2697027 RepID=A0A4R1NEW2_9GAMM|nr:YdgH/BhsA/McbA-like domain containing protein [Sodalis ligni]TCL05973.1 multiple stress resistance protein BhsA [Sodalis ligni]
MKNVKYTIVAIALGTLSFGSFAADLVSSAPAEQQQVGVITVTGAHDVTSVENQLAEKAAQSGARSFRITSVTGNNQMRGTAEIYE